MNSPYSNVFWKILRGESEPSDIIKLHIGPHWRAESGGCKKITENLNSVSGSAYMDSLESLKRMLPVARDALVKGKAQTILEDVSA